MSYLKIFVFISSASFSLGGGQANFLRQLPQHCRSHIINCRLMHILEICYDVLKSAHGIESKGKNLQNGRQRLVGAGRIQCPRLTHP